MPKISLIIPVYNAQKFLPRALQSSINQTFKDIEIIIVDDKSEDESLKIALEFAKKDQRIK
ncbi:glycosyltransferase family 2 protein, partial [Campylobacter sp. W0018]|uniref:glycosyltransferase family 2 protein n=1 Tax=Campylobacter sp. W0018 TaxID=2735782 RepID=UPI00301D9C0E|nr:glycosyltransferase family 2 protein [Campylobacter sp. W0018]